MRIHRLLSTSKANGPGTRFVVWVQGCSRQCAGCFNPLTHDFDGGYEMAVSEIANQIPLDEVDGITVSGGEPFEQAEELAALLEEAGRKGLDRLVYTGFSYEELCGRSDHAVRKCLSLIDTLVDGPYEQGMLPRMPWTGSGNQCMLQLRNGEIVANCRENDLEGASHFEGELIIEQNGGILVTGMINSKILEEGERPCST